SVRTPIAAAIASLPVPALTNHNFSSLGIPDVSQPLRTLVSVLNHFNSERHLVDRQTFKLRRSAALAEWQSLMA
ncbi:MAG: hypothetical protein ABIQ66_04455, partial [Novosphingobium sp.]